MSITATPAFIQTPAFFGGLIPNSVGAYTFVAGGSSSTGLIQLLSSTANGIVLESVSVTTTETSSNKLWLLLVNHLSGAQYPINVTTIPANSGTDGSTLPVDLLRGAQAPALPLDVNTNALLYVPQGYDIYAGMQTAVASGKQVTITALGGNL